MSVDFDTVLHQVGDFGLYQKALYLLICLPASFPSAWSAFNQVFVAAIPEHWCRVPGVRGRPVDQQAISNLSIPFVVDSDGTYRHSRCTQYVPLNSSSDDVTSAYNSSYDEVGCLDGWIYNHSDYSSTIVTEFSLVCDREYLSVACSTIFYVGSFIGNILFGYIADKWGRRASFYSLLAIQVLFGTASAFAQDIISFTALRFILGLTFPALYQIPFIIGMELMGPSGRLFAGMVVCMLFGFAMGCLGIVASWIREWRLLIIVCNAPYAVLFVYWFFLPESPRWLVSVNKCQEATEVLLNVAKWNKRQVNEVDILKQCEEITRKVQIEVTDIQQHSLADLFRTPNLRKKTIIVTFVWIVNALAYNVLTFNVSNLGVNDYYAFAINGIVEVPGYILIWPLLSKFGRRWLLTGTLFIGGMACVSTCFTPADNRWVISSLAFMGKFGTSASFSIIYIFGGELYPTVVRALGMGFSSMIAGASLLMAPHIAHLGGIVFRDLPLLIVGVLALCAGLASMFLPETLGSHLPQTINDAENFGKSFPFCYCPLQSYSSSSSTNSEHDATVYDKLVGNSHHADAAQPNHSTHSNLHVDRHPAAANFELNALKRTVTI